MGNISPKVFDLDLFRFFATRGYKLHSAKIIYDKETQKSKGFGYLNFHEEAEADRCLAEMNNETMDGKQILLSKKKNNDFDSKANVLVKNLPKEMDQKELNELFSRFGTIGSCKLEVYSDGTSRCFGYVQFENVEHA